VTGGNNSRFKNVKKGEMTVKDAWRNLAMRVSEARDLDRKFIAMVAIGIGLCSFLGLIFFFRNASLTVKAAPIPPPQGYPKLSLSTKVVSPTLAHTGGATLHYTVEILNTGAYTAQSVSFSDPIPANTSYKGDAHSSSGNDPTFSNGALSWVGDVGFDSSVEITFSVVVASSFSGMVKNQAVIDHPSIPKPVTVTAETVVTDHPIFSIRKSSKPDKPGPNKAITYSITVSNQGQPASDLPITVTDQVPTDTTLLSIGPDGTADPTGTLVTWKRTVSLDTGAESVFLFTANVNDVVSGTVVTNSDYKVSSSETGVVAGEPYTVTVISPILSITKAISPDPPGSNQPMTYTLTVFNTGSEATNLVVQDRVPSGVSYVSGGAISNGIVYWSLPKLDSGKFARFSFVAYVGDVADLDLLNSDYSVCSSEGVCKFGTPLKSLVIGPTFQGTADMDPVAKKPGGGTGPVTPTLTIKNLGPGNALDAFARLSFSNISVQLKDLVTKPARGSYSKGPSCGLNCVSYNWVGNISTGETITFTTNGGQSTIGGDEGTLYTATIEITDTLGVTTTKPVSVTAIGKVTHLANLIATKTAPDAIGAGQTMTYTLAVYNSGLSTDTPPSPWLTDTVPLSTTLMSVSDGGIVTTIDGRSVISWTLPAMSPGEIVYRNFSVMVDPDLISGTQIINSDYGAAWFNIGDGILSNPGEPYTTTVKEIGLIDSFKTVTPNLVRLGTGNILTYTVHVVNSSPMPLYGVMVDDLLPWQDSTYQRDAVATAGQIISDIAGIKWIGNVGAYSSQLITFTVLVDPDFQGAITNTATISHPTLLEDVIVKAVAYVTNEPVLRIFKTASPNPVSLGGELLYSLDVVNLGQQATSLVLTDTIPLNVQYIEGSASSSGQLIGRQIRWEFPVLPAGENLVFTFRVTVLVGKQVVNDQYRVTCTEGVSYSGPPIITLIQKPPGNIIFIPFMRH
jgi:uncharacterized repeat protein (TIGR01451 family)